MTTEVLVENSINALYKDFEGDNLDRYLQERYLTFTTKIFFVLD